MSGGRGYSNLNSNRNNQRGYNNGYNNNDRGRGFRRNKYNNNNNSNNRNNNNNSRNNLPKEALPPITYEAKQDKQNQIKIKWTTRRGATTLSGSEKVAVYDNTAKED